MVLLDFWVNAIVSFQFATIHNWYPRALHFLFFSHESALSGRRQEHFSWACASLLRSSLSPFLGCIFWCAGWLGHLIEEFFFCCICCGILFLCIFLFHIKKNTNKQTKTPFNCIGAQPINSVVIVSGEQQRDSVIHINVSILSKLPSHSLIPFWRENQWQ